MKRNENMIVGIGILFIIVAIYIVNLKFPNNYWIYASDEVSYDKATVKEILSEAVEYSSDYHGWKLGTQEVLVVFTSGESQGEEISVVNNLSTSHNIDIGVGSKIIVKADKPPGITPYYSIYNYDRDTGLILVALLFIFSMLAVAKFKGLKSVLGLCMTLYIIAYFLLPAIYRGWSPIYCTIISVILISTISLVLLNGFCEKTYTAIISTILGVIISAIFFMALQHFLKLSGYNLEEADKMIMISRSTGLKIKEVFFSAVLISSLGAVIDTAMSIAASIYEIREVHPSMEKSQLYKSGVSIGQDMIGTMCQTLILAFVGSSIATLLVLISYGTQMNQFISSDYIALEVVQAISGSMAIVFTVPITAYLSTITHQRVKKCNTLRV